MLTMVVMVTMAIEYFSSAAFNDIKLLKALILFLSILLFFLKFISFIDVEKLYIFLKKSIKTSTPRKQRKKIFEMRWKISNFFMTFSIEKKTWKWDDDKI